MPNINDLFPSKYLRASDLVGKTRRVTIQSVVVEEVSPGEQKPVVYFTNAPKPLVLNKTNGLLLASLFGQETTQWTGLEVELYSEQVRFKSGFVDGIRVRQVPPPAVAAVETKSDETPAEQPVSEDIDW